MQPPSDEATQAPARRAGADQQCPSPARAADQLSARVPATLDEQLHQPGCRDGHRGLLPVLRPAARPGRPQPTPRQQPCRLAASKPASAFWSPSCAARHPEAHRRRQAEQRQAPSAWSNATPTNSRPACTPSAPTPPHLLMPCHAEPCRLPQQPVRRRVTAARTPTPASRRARHRSVPERRHPHQQADKAPPRLATNPKTPDDEAASSSDADAQGHPETVTAKCAPPGPWPAPAQRSLEQPGLGRSADARHRTHRPPPLRTPMPTLTPAPPRPPMAMPIRPAPTPASPATRRPTSNLAPQVSLPAASRRARSPGR